MTRPEMRAGAPIIDRMEKAKLGIGIYRLIEMW
jgi:hypothetical protein